MAWIDRRPRGLLRFFFRAPIVLYRAGLGRLLGRRLLYLVHTGRKSGRRREVVLEVVALDRERPEAFVVAAWGERSDWFRNIVAAPPVQVQVGSSRWRGPQFRVLSTPETVRLLTDYRRRHRFAWNRLAPVLGLPLDPRDESAAEGLKKIRSVAFRPVSTER